MAVEPTQRTLHAYLLGSLEYDAVLSLQRRLMYDIGGDRSTGALILCEHPAIITMGREASRIHVRPTPESLNAREWRVRWVSRGGGAMLHLPGQVACYPLLPLDTLGQSPGGFLRTLQQVIQDLLHDHDIASEADTDGPGVRVHGRRIAHIGVAIRDWVSGFGLVLNVSPDLEQLREVHCDGDPTPMTSIQRETAQRVRMASVRQRLVELLAGRFGFTRVSVFHHHPAIQPKPAQHAATTHTR